MSGIPTANSPDNRNLADSTVVIETGIAEYSYFTNLSYGYLSLRRLMNPIIIHFLYGKNGVTGYNEDSVLRSHGSPGSFASSFSWFIASFGLVGIDGEDVKGSYGMMGMLSVDLHRILPKFLVY